MYVDNVNILFLQEGLTKTCLHLTSLKEHV